MPSRHIIDTTLYASQSGSGIKTELRILIRSSNMCFMLGAERRK